MKPLTMTQIFQSILILTLCAASALSQVVGARVQGTVKDNDKPIAGAEVVITNSDASAAYKGKTDENGVFEIPGIPTGNNYQLEVINPAGLKVFVSQKLAFNADAAEPAVLAIDTSDVSKTNLQAALEKRHYTREEIDALKAQRAKAQAENGLIRQAVEAMTAKQWENAIAPLQQLIAYDPDRYEFYQSLGEAQLNLGRYDEALQSLEKGIQVARSNAPSSFSNPANDPAKKKSRITAMLMEEGNAFYKLKNVDKAIDAYTQAARNDPDSGVAQFNLCATLYNAQKIDAALPVCERSIALDPARADTYFIKGRLLFTKSKRAGDGTLHAPAGTAAALNKYLELAPEGPHVKDARDMLAGIAGK
jgi:tetratricopeptide (TPR) repeat protein